MSNINSKKRATNLTVLDIARFDHDLLIYIEDEEALKNNQGGQAAMPVCHARMAIINNEPAVLITPVTIQRADITMREDEANELDRPEEETRRLAL